MHRSGRASARAGAGLLLAALGIFGACGLGAACGEAEPRRARDVVLIVVDTLRADQTSVHGYERRTTPFLERFAREHGQVFEQARSPAPWTKPSVASILTGIDPREHQLLTHVSRLASGARTLAEAFAELGYDTAAIQSNKQLMSIFGFAQGFAHYDEEHLATHRDSTGAAVNAAAFRWLDETREREKPFFLYVHHYEPHFDYLRSGETYHPGYAGRLTGAEGIHDLEGALDQLLPEDIEFLRARYDAEILYQDELLEQLYAGLESRGLLENAVVVITADHGEEFAEHGDLQHKLHKAYDELLHVPLLVALPDGFRRGARIAQSVSTADIGRTLLDACGMARTPFDGESLLPDLLGRARAPRDVHSYAALLQDEPKPTIVRESIVSGGMKLIRDVHSGALELYELGTDPDERNDLAAARNDLARELEQRLATWRAAHPMRVFEGNDAPVELSPELVQRLRDLGYLDAHELEPPAHENER
jgi:choline-sulfatase